MSNWVSAIGVIILILIMVVIIGAVIYVKFLKVKIMKNGAQVLKNKAKGGIMPEDIGDFILGCCSSH